MSKGRKPIPTQLKVVKGTFQKCRENADEPIVNTNKSDIRKPRGLSKLASKHWDKIIRHLTEAGIMSTLDIDALTMYCEAYARWQDAMDDIKNNGTITTAPSGYPVQSPYISIANKAFDQMKAMMTEFGMTPSSRSKVSAKKEQKKSAWDEF